MIFGFGSISKAVSKLQASKHCVASGKAELSDVVRVLLFGYVDLLVLNKNAEKGKIMCVELVNLQNYLSCRDDFERNFGKKK